MKSSTWIKRKKLAASFLFQCSFDPRHMWKSKEDRCKWVGVWERKKIQDSLFDDYMNAYPLPHPYDLDEYEPEKVNLKRKKVLCCPLCKASGDGWHPVEMINFETFLLTNPAQSDTMVSTSIKE